MKKVTVKKIKRFKDFIEYHKTRGIGECAWNMDDVFTMLDYLAEKIEKLSK